MRIELVGGQLRGSTAMVTITSKSIGDPDRFLTFADLSSRFDTLPGTPQSEGCVVLIVRRREGGRRETPERLRLTAEGGVAGDAWSERQPDPAGQIAVMQANVAMLIANGQPLTLFGDNLFLDLGLSVENLPHGSRVRVGAAMLEITPKAHNGCHKFQARFGSDALRFVSHKELRHLNLRGIYMRVLEPGDVGVGDWVHVISRAGPHP